ncbi:MAG: hypothetical protein M3Z24_13195 [Chloroflexota bacterium]|nr:hypothetical protein [Chloroflexota bacterium]
MPIYRTHRGSRHHDEDKRKKQGVTGYVAAAFMTLRSRVQPWRRRTCCKADPEVTESKRATGRAS